MVTQSTPLSQLATVANLRDEEWSTINDVLSSILAPLHAELANDVAPPREAAVEFATLAEAHLEHHGAIKRREPATSSHQHHRDRAVIRLTKRLARLKNSSRKQFPSERNQFLNAVRVHNKALKAARQQQQQKSGMKQEKCFRNNPWKYAKSVCSKSEKFSPTFSQATCFQYFQRVSSDMEVSYKILPDWVYRVSSPPDETEEYSPFDLTAVTPGQVKRILQCSTSSSPGSDGITYFHLRKLPCTHHFLATV